MTVTDVKNRKMFRILIIGGTGETGRKILGYLSNSHDNIGITVVGRHEPSGKEDYSYVKIRLEDFNDAVSIVGQYDLVIAACGPMEKLLPNVLDICIAAGVDVIDINDSAKAARAVLEKHESAVKAGVRIYSGMGMSPGITSLMLRTLAEARLSPSGVYRARICMGTAYGGGRSSPYAMLDNLSQNILVYQDCEAGMIKNTWRDGYSDFLFVGKKKKLTGVHYATPEIYALASERYDGNRAFVRSYDVRCFMEGFPLWAARLISVINKNGRFSDFLASLFYKSGQRMKRNPKADPDNQVVIFPDGDENKGIMLFGDVSSYDLTAAMAASAADCLIDGRLKEKAGVYTVELLTDESFEALKKALESRNVCWKSVAEVRNAGYDRWGWLESDCHDVGSLRHYGKNWYGVRIHPRMKDVQADILFGSGLWAEIRKVRSGPGLMLFVLKMMMRRMRNIRTLRSIGKKDSVHAALVKDMSMFAAGYSVVREIFGQEKAYELYREMFLTAGNAEMCWFLPRPETFSRMSCPEDAVLDYFKAMTDKNRECGFLSLKCTEKDSGGDRKVVFEIRDCTYASIFNLLGCHELADLIRLEEKQEIKRLTAGTGLSCDYRLLGNGDADLVFTRSHGRLGAA